MLAHAAPGYLDDHDWDSLGEDWLEQALAYTATPCKGARGPLTRIRPRPDDLRVNRQPHYRLADYLEQLGRTERAGTYPPESLWTAFAATGAADPCSPHGTRARERSHGCHRGLLTPGWALVLQRHSASETYR
ncbi:hypothetical protein [Krasilnikovia cinnamomea]|uniref:hypothetical protein n=1 Tax=Krasilnikovia cinnamomea TaxID=349313 RepID=UPI00102CD368|nr:hypothetical protein [Krasilnikovia cinnamomea]